MHIRSIIPLICLVSLSRLIFGQIPANIPTPALTNDIVHVSAAKEALQNDNVYQHMTNHANTAAVSTGTVVLPVVVHIIHESGAENISDAQVNSALVHINDAFRASASGINMEIQFCLAKQNPDGNSSTGINRVASPLTNITMESTDAALKQLIIWNPAKYINIWIVKSITSSASGPAIAAYSTMPLSHGTSVDGIVIEAGVFGVSDELSRIAVHNMGHFLGLYHTFDHECRNDNCMLDGDLVCDTPPDATTQYVNCSAVTNSCNSDDDDLSANNPFRPVSNGGIGDQPDMNSNYMDHNYLFCLNSFTQGQKERANAMLQVNRSSLLVSGACNPGCTYSIQASFTIPASVFTQEQITFTNTSTPQTGVTYEWYLNGTLFSIAKSPVYTFANPGIYTVKLIIKGGTSACVDEYTKEFTADCQSRADFIPSSTLVSPYTTIYFKNTTEGNFSSEWLVNDIVKKTGGDYYVSFRNPGFYTISLKIVSGTCTSRKDVVIEVNNCSQLSKHANNWYFGKNCGITFRDGNPDTNTNNTTTTENACASISDIYGNFLFSAIPAEGSIPNYQTMIRDKNFNIMPNGANVAGSTTGSQILIVPNPGNTNIYYVFSTFAEASGGLYVTTVDISKNGGLGDVTAKNVLLHNLTTEKIASTMDSNGTDIWVATHPWNSQNFYVYKINLGGLVTTPVISTVGSVLNGDKSGASGVMKFSPNGKYLAMAAQYAANAFVEVYDFDNKTGKVTSFFRLTDLPNAYGLEFSPDASKLYVSCWEYGNENRGINQYNLALNNSRDIINSKYSVFKYLNYGQMQLGPDQKIYFSMVSENYMPFIQSPNKAGAECNFTRWGFLLSSGSVTQCRYGLPSFVSNYVVPIKTKIQGPAEAIPNANQIKYVLKPDIEKNINVVWRVLGEGYLMAQSYGTALVHFNSAGTAKIITTVNFPCGNVYDTLIVNIRNPSINLGPDQIICTGSSILLDPGSKYLNYRWQDGSTASTYRVTRPGTYSVTVTSAGGATAYDEIVITQAAPFNLGADRTVCPGSVVTLNPGSNFTNYRWQDGSTAPTYTAFQQVPQSGVTYRYSVRATDLCGQTVSDEINITFSAPAANAGADVSTCIQDPVVLSGTGNGIPRWYDESGLQIGTTSNISVNPANSTFYVFTADLNGCIGKDTVAVTITPDCSACSVSAGPDKTICAGETVTLNAATNGHCTRNNCSFRMPPKDCSSGCTRTLSGSGYANINPGEVVCILQGTTFSGGVNITGGTLLVCGTANMTSINLNSGRVIVNGTLTVPSMSVSGIFENYGNTTITYDCSVNSPGQLINYSNMTINSTLSSSSRTDNFSTLNIGRNLCQNGNDVFTNECTITIGNDIFVGSTFINKGTVTAANSANLNGGSQFIADDGSLLSVKNISCSGLVQGGTSGNSSIKVSENTNIFGSATITENIDICDADGIEHQWGVLANTVTLDCRCQPDGAGGVATFIWSDNNGNTIGTGKTLSVTPASTSTYTITVIDVFGTQTTDNVKVTVNNCP